MTKKEQTTPTQPSLFGLVTTRKSLLVGLLVFPTASVVLTLVQPWLMGRAIDAFQQGTFNSLSFTTLFTIVAIASAVTMYIGGIFERLSGEGVTRDLRRKLMDKISRQSMSYLTNVTPDKLLTNLTSDAQAVKMFASQAVVVIISSLCMIVGAAILMLLLNWKLTIVVLLAVPLIGGTFAVIFGKVGPLFGAAQQLQDRLNRVITESITGASLVRVINAQGLELQKFVHTNTEAKDIGIRILSLFALLFPVITLFGNLAQLAIVALGGHFVITNSMSLGDFAAFNAYLALLIFPLIMIGFMSNVISQAQVSYGRMLAVLNEPDPVASGTSTHEITGALSVQDLSLELGGKPVLRHVALTIKPGTRNAIIGPTAAGKTQLLNILTGLIEPTSGTVTYDGIPLAAYDPTYLHRKVALVFQDSVMFNLSLRENIAFGGEVAPEVLEKAIRAAELQDVIEALPQGLDTLVSERGLNLSGGQKQRIMLARALALNPTVLLLDDFTARVDNETERKILANLTREYPDVTLLSVTQKIASVMDYDQIVLLMEGELFAQGTHAELMVSSPEYVQIYTSQQSTTDHE